MKWFWINYMRARVKWLALVLILIIFQGFVYQQFLVLTESGLRVIFSSGSFNELIWVCLAILLIFSVRGFTSFVIPTISAKLYSNSRDDLVMYYFRDGANYASVYTKSRILSENIKWNLKQKSNRIFSLLINTRNANAFTGVKGYQALQKLARSKRINP